MFIAITFGFTTGDQSVDEDSGAVTLQVSVIAGTLQHSADITFNTAASTSGNTAASEHIFISCFFNQLL